MTQNEFTELLGKEVPEAEWDIIQTVYTWHPAIPNVGGKPLIVKLYKNFGFAFIKALFTHARQLELANNDLRNAQLLVEKLENELVAQTSMENNTHEVRLTAIYLKDMQARSEARQAVRRIEQNIRWLEEGDESHD